MDFFFDKYLAFVTKVMCIKFGAEKPTSNFSQGGPLAMTAILAAILGKIVDEKRHLITKILLEKGQ